jgi:hypothetical protein
LFGWVNCLHLLKDERNNTSKTKENKKQQQQQNTESQSMHHIKSNHLKCKENIALVIVPLPCGCGTMKPGMWKRDSAVEDVGRSSEKPQVVREPTRSTKFLRA